MSIIGVGHSRLRSTFETLQELEGVLYDTVIIDSWECPDCSPVASRFSYILDGAVKRVDFIHWDGRHDYNVYGGAWRGELYYADAEGKRYVRETYRTTDVFKTDSEMIDALIDDIHSMAHPEAGETVLRVMIFDPKGIVRLNEFFT